MNILVLGTSSVEKKLIKLCLKSKHLDHIYTASSQPLEDIPNIEYKTYEDLISKVKALQIDIVLVADKSLISNGITEIFRKNLINIISVNKKWLNLETSRLVAKQLMNYYSINNPNVIKAPVVFPLVIKTDNPNTTKIAYSMDELVEITKDLASSRTFLEDYLNGEISYLLSLWDGKNLYHFPLPFSLTEVQEDRLDLYKTKLSIMFSDEKPDFIGFFTSKLIWAKNDWYVIEYIMHLNEKPDLDVIKSDFLFILNSAIYQKLNEIQS